MLRINEAGVLHRPHEVRVEGLSLEAGYNGESFVELELVGIGAPTEVQLRADSPRRPVRHGCLEVLYPGARFWVGERMFTVVEHELNGAVHAR